MEPKLKKTHQKITICTFSRKLMKEWPGMNRCKSCSTPSLQPLGRETVVWRTRLGSQRIKVCFQETMRDNRDSWPRMAASATQDPWSYWTCWTYWTINPRTSSNPQKDRGSQTHAKIVIIHINHPSIRLSFWGFTIVLSPAWRFSKVVASPNHPKQYHFSIETHGDLGIHHFKNPPKVVNNHKSH